MISSMIARSLTCRMQKWLAHISLIANKKRLEKVYIMRTVDKGAQVGEEEGKGKTLTLFIARVSLEPPRMLGGPRRLLYNMFICVYYSHLIVAASSYQVRRWEVWCSCHITRSKGY